MIAWRCVYGDWLVEPVPQITHHWLSPSLWDIFVSQDRSLFYWTPICALAFLGFLLSWRSLHPLPAAILFAAFALQGYALGAMWGKGDFLRDVGNFAGAFLSRAYGMRHLTEAVVLLAPGLAILLERAAAVFSNQLCRVTPFRIFAGVAFALVLWNLAIFSQYNQRLLPVDAGAAPGTLIANFVQLLEADPWTSLAFAEALVLICLVLLWGKTGPPEMIAPNFPARAASSACSAAEHPSVSRIWRPMSLNLL
jgi:hypothetical protein